MYSYSTINIQDCISKINETLMEIKGRKISDLKGNVQSSKEHIHIEYFDANLELGLKISSAIDTTDWYLCVEYIYTHGKLENDEIEVQRPEEVYVWTNSIGANYTQINGFESIPENLNRLTIVCPEVYLNLIGLEKMQEPPQNIKINRGVIHTADFPLPHTQNTIYTLYDNIVSLDLTPIAFSENSGFTAVHSVIGDYQNRFEIFYGGECEIRDGRQFQFRLPDVLSRTIQQVPNNIKGMLLNEQWLDIRLDKTYSLLLVLKNEIQDSVLPIIDEEITRLKGIANSTDNLGF